MEREGPIDGTVQAGTLMQARVTVSPWEAKLMRHVFIVTWQYMNVLSTNGRAYPNGG
jgi:hypothetical protein